MAFNSVACGWNFMKFILPLLLLQMTRASHVNPAEIEVFCDKEMMVRVTFQRPFEGIIYSRGFYNERRCRYLSADQHPYKMSTFNVPFDSCGTRLDVKPVTNTLVIQQHPVVETAWDQVQNITCPPFSSTGDLSLSSAIQVLGKPPKPRRSVDQLVLESRMDLKTGPDPLDSETVENVKVGDRLMVVITVHGASELSGLKVKNCIAHTENVMSDSSSYKLSDEAGCPLHSHMLSAFSVVRDGNASLVAYAEMTAFRFTGQGSLVLTCAVHPCDYECSSYCSSTVHGSKVKRSIPDERSSPKLSQRRLLMKATIKALANKLMSTDGPEGTFEKRYLKPVDDPIQSGSEDEKALLAASDESDLGVAAADSFDTYNVSKAFNIISDYDFLTADAPQGTNSTNTDYCFPKVTFTVAAVLLSLALLLLSVTCVAQCLYVRKEKKKRLIDGFLLNHYT